MDSGPLEALVLLPGRLSRQVHPAHFSQVAAYAAPSEDIQGRRAIYKRSPNTLYPIQLPLFLCRIGHSLIHHICLLAYVACASLEWKPHGGRDLGWVMAVYLEKSVTYCRRSRDPFE